MNKSHPDFDATDAALAARLRAIAPPSDLRRKLLALSPPPRRTSRWAVPLPAFALAAVALLALVSIRSENAGSIAAARTHFAQFFNSDFSLDVTGQPLPALRVWLSARGLAPTARIPRGLAARVPEGCREITWGGQRGALICFETPHGLAHLIMLPNAAFADAAPAAPRAMTKVAGWNSAAWSDGTYTYLVFTQGNAAVLRDLLAVRRGLAPPTS